MTSMSSDETYSPTYRQRDVDDTLDDHEGRITRLEKIALLSVGYGLAEGWTIITDIGSLLP
jgi:hypothetical protein